MSVVPSHSLPSRAAFTTEPLFRLSVDQYHELIRSGKLSEDDPVELLEGLLVFKMPKNTPHTTATGLSRREVEHVLPADWHYRSQEPLTLSDSEPEPDGAVVRGRIEDYAQRHPRPSDTALVIEVADTSLERDRGLKLRTYARAGIPVYWIINLVARQVEVYFSPSGSGADATYHESRVYRSGDVVPLELPDRAAANVAVDSLLPPPG
jgi:Uma2 family endonuclease